MLRTALLYLAIGISVIPLRPRSKRPLIEWQEFTERLPTERELERWFPSGSHNNIGGVMGKVSGLVAVDADNPQDAQLLLARLPGTSMTTKTSRGVHMLFKLCPGRIVAPRVHANVLGVRADIRGENSYIVLADSVHPTGARYEQIGTWNPAEVPYFEETWLSLKDQGDLASPIKRRELVRNVDSYLARVESVQGQHGSAGLVRACSICHDAGLSESEATITLLHWNSLPVVSPPWSPAELARAITRTYARGV